MNDLELATMVGVRFKHLRFRSKLNQAEAAQRYGVGKSTWQRIEAGNLPTGALLAALARDGHNVNWLLTGEGEPRRADAEGLDRHVAEEAMLAVTDMVRAERARIPDESLRRFFEEMYDSFVSEARAADADDDKT